MQIYAEFTFVPIKFCRSPTSNFMRPRSVLLAFHTQSYNHFAPYSCPKNLMKNPTKNLPERLKMWPSKRCFLAKCFFRILGVILKGLASQIATKYAQKAFRILVEPFGKPIWSRCIGWHRLVSVLASILEGFGHPTWGQIGYLGVPRWLWKLAKSNFWGACVQDACQEAPKC